MPCYTIYHFDSAFIYMQLYQYGCPPPRFPIFVAVLRVLCCEVYIADSSPPRAPCAISPSSGPLRRRSPGASSHSSLYSEQQRGAIIHGPLGGFEYLDVLC